MRMHPPTTKNSPLLGVAAAAGLSLALLAPAALAQVQRAEPVRQVQPAPRNAVARPAPRPADAETIKRLIADLGAADYATRESATADLSLLPLKPEELARHAPPADQMTPEQWERFEAALVIRFVDTPRAGLGVQFAQERVADVEGVTLAAVVPEFPAVEFLRPGDIIIEIDGTPVVAPPEGQLAMQSCILSHDPGESLALTVLRRDEENGELREHRLTVPLGSYDQLRNGLRLHDDLALAAWQVRRARMGLTPPATPVISLRPDGVAWPAKLFDKSLLAGPALVAGGRPGSQAIDLRTRLRLANQGNQEILVRDGQVRFVQRANVEAVQRTNEARLKAQAQLQGELETIQEILRSHRQRIADPNLDPKERAEFEQAIRDLMQQAVLLRTSIERLRE